MTEKVKDHKSQFPSAPIESEAARWDEESVVPLVESNVCLYKYGGFALHSLIKKYTKTDGHVSHDHDSMLVILKQLTIKQNQLSLVPYGIHQLNEGGLVIMDPLMLPYLRVLIEKVASFINEDQSREFGKHMIEMARSKIESDNDINETFIRCIKNVGMDPLNPINSRI